MIVDAAIKRGDKVYTGKRHFQIIKDMIADGCEKPIKNREQGFTDENGRFYDRRIALEVAKRAGQVPKIKFSVLLSEDLW